MGQVRGLLETSETRREGSQEGLPGGGEGSQEGLPGGGEQQHDPPYSLGAGTSSRASQAPCSRPPPEEANFMALPPCDRDSRRSQSIWQGAVGIGSDTGWGLQVPSPCPPEPLTSRTAEAQPTPGHTPAEALPPEGRLLPRWCPLWVESGASQPQPPARPQVSV